MLKKSIDWEPTVFTIKLFWSVGGGKLRFWLTIGSIWNINAQETHFEFARLQYLPRPFGIYVKLLVRGR